ncbi:hypothetical protein K457DRAFT_605334 [Linnemannia elongata AG-77]|uniref:Uncharacterized protein n=1 Tax=Linnemannia elongata AG-77 TaxID=1314771 RepID=A0A197JRZ5_9FUNG|nr:hypothetical protein K457DRAFT_605334 [Linnemannia elongata AG-77]
MTAFASLSTTVALAKEAISLFWRHRSAVRCSLCIHQSLNHYHDDLEELDETNVEPEAREVREADKSMMISVLVPVQTSAPEQDHYSF